MRKCLSYKKVKLGAIAASGTSTPPVDREGHNTTFSVAIATQSSPSLAKRWAPYYRLFTR